MAPRRVVSKGKNLKEPGMFKYTNIFILLLESLSMKKRKSEDKLVMEHEKPSKFESMATDTSKKTKHCTKRK